MDKPDIDAIQRFYENVSYVWPRNNQWYEYTQEQIRGYVLKKIPSGSDRILNAGSGGNDYSITTPMHHVDLAKNKIDRHPYFTVANIEKLPFGDESFGKIICVGSVLNYCDAISALTELSRVLNRNGTLILEFESSWGLEHRKTTAYKKLSTTRTFEYINSQGIQWLFSPFYIMDILSRNNLSVINSYGFHYLSAYIYSLGWDENSASAFAKYDSIFRRLPWLHWHADNMIFLCRKGL